MADLIAVCMVTYNSAGDLAGCLAAVEAQDYRPLEVVVVDCASSDGSHHIAEQIEIGGIPKKVVALDENLGFAGGMNVAFAHTAAPYVLLLNADARPQPDFVSRLLEGFGRLEGEPVGAVTGRLVRLAKDGPPRLDACGMYLVPTWRHLDRGSSEVDTGQWDQPERVFGATGAATLFATQALRDVSLDGEVFDTAFHSYREDAELCFRLQERRWQVLYEPSAVAEHRRRVLPERRGQLPAAINYHSLKNRYLLRAYHQTGGNFLRTFLPTLFRDVLALGYVLMFERESLKAYVWLWQNRRRIHDRRRRIQGRRTAPAKAVERWFRHRSLPL